MSKENRGGLWKNSRKETDKHPDFTGSINVEGKEYWISMWDNADNENPKAPVYSLSVSEKQAKKDDDIPF